MLNSADLYAFAVTTPLTTSLSPSATVYGISFIRYEVRRYIDVRNGGNKLAYQVLCTHRIILPNQTPYTPGAQPIQAFNGYPAVIENQISVKNQPDGAPSPELINYSPKTLNSAVVTSINQSDGKVTSSSQQHTSGSSTSQSNTFGASASIGFFGEVPTGGLALDYQHGWGSDQSSSDSTGSEKGKNVERSSGESMSVKDWGCYTYLGRTTTNDPMSTWIWGQEYPWDVIQFRNAPTGNNITLPSFVSNVLYDGTQVFPPSQLSVFGVDFTMKSVWIVEPPDTLTQPETIIINHATDYYTATHKLSGGNLQANINSGLTFNYQSPAIDLSTYALDPILNAEAGNGAVMGFVANKFIIQPSANGSFRAISSANNLQVTGTGFQITGTGNDSIMSSSFDQGPAAVQIQFKIIDHEYDYALYLKHWNGQPTGCVLSIVINGDTQNPIIKHVDTMEAQGGDNNLTTISLRNQDFASIEYHDYLNYGLNTISITITPNELTNCEYVLKALAIASA